MQKPLVASGILVVLLIIAALIAPSFIDWNSHRPEVVEAVHEFTRLDVSVEGDLSFRLIPSPALSARALTLANVEGGVAEHILVVEGLDINVDFFSLLGGDIQVSSVLLDTPVIALERDAEGRANWDLILAGGDEGEQGDRDVSLERFVIENGTISYRDALTGQHEELTNINANISTKSVSGPLDSNGTFEYRGVPLVIEAAIGLMTPGRRTPVKVTAVIAGQTPGITFNGSALLDEGAREAKGRLTGGGSDLGALLAGLAELGGGSFAAPVNLAHGYGLDADLLASEDSLAIESISFKVASTTGEGSVIVALGEEAAVNATLSLTTVKVEDWLPVADDETGEATTVAGEDFALPENLSGALEVTVGALEYREGIARQVSVIAKLQDAQVTLEEARVLMPGGSDLVLTGALTADGGKPKFTGRLRAASNNLRGLASWLGYDTSEVPEGQMANFALDGAVEVGGAQARLYDAKVSLDITEATGSASIDFGNDAYVLDASFNRLNLDAYLPPAAAKADASWQATTKSVRDALKPLAEIDAEIKLKGDQLTLSGASISGVTIDATLKDGALELKRFALASMEGVRFDVRGRIRNLAAEPSGNLAVDIESPNLNRFVRWSKIELPTEASSLSRVAMKGKLVGTMKDLEVDLQGVAARGAYRIKGKLGGLSPMPSSIAVEFEVGHSSHTDLIQRLNLPIEVSGEGQTTRIYGTLEGAPDDLRGNVRIEALGAKASVTGSYAGLMGEEGAPQSFDLSLALSHENFTALAQNFDASYAPSGGALGAVQAVVSLKGTDKNFSLSGIQATLGPMNIQGGITVDRAGERPNITGALKAGSLALDPFMASATAGAAQSIRSGGERWSRKPLELAQLRDFDAALEFSADEISFRDYRYVEPAMTINLNNGVLTVPHFRSGMFDGTAAMEVRLDVTTDLPAMTIGFDLRDVDMAGIMPAFFGASTVTGKMSLAGQFAGAGVSQFDIVSSLAGQAQFLAHDGELPLCVSCIYQSVKQNSLLKSGGLNRAMKAGGTPYSQIETQITVADGVVRIPPTATLTEQGDSLRGGGTINLPAWTVDMKGDIRLALMGSFPPVPYSYAGKIDKAKMKYSWGQFLVQLATERAANQLQGIVGSGAGLDALSDLTGGQAPISLLGGKPAASEQPVEQSGATSSLLGGQPATSEEAGEQPAKPTVEDVAKGIISLLGGKKKKKEPDQPEDDNGGN